jgi:hypothetical protein
LKEKEVCPFTNSFGSSRYTAENTTQKMLLVLGSDVGRKDRKDNWREKGSRS